MKHTHTLLALIPLLVLALAGCGGGGGGGGGGNGKDSGPVTITISPLAVQLDVPGDSVIFTATVTGTTNTTVSWSVQIVTGTTAGSIVYTGPNTAKYTPSSFGTFNVVATSQADPTKSAIAQVQVGPPGPPVIP